MFTFQVSPSWNACIANEEVYWPCYCWDPGWGSWVTCPYVPLSVIAQAFKEPVGWNLTSIALIIPPTDEFIPANLLGGNVVQHGLELECQHSGSQRLTIHPDAFKASRNFVLSIKVKGCDLSGFNFSFLKHFCRLEALRFTKNANFHRAAWITFPPLPALHYFQVLNMQLDQWAHFPVLVNGLKTVDLGGNLIGNEAMDRILQWLLDSPSAKTLNVLNIVHTLLTEVPQKITSFKNFLELFMGQNPITTIRSGSIIANANVSDAANFGIIALHSCNIDAIEPGSFQGI